MFLNHKFNKRLGLWHQLGIDGSIGPMIDTFNQQVWFALSGFLICEQDYFNPLIKERLEIFFENIFDNLYLFNSGLICHGIPKSRLNKISSFNNYFDIYIKKMKKVFYEQSLGYHSFNLYAKTMVPWRSSDNYREKEELLFDVLEQECANKKAIIFVATKKMCDELQNHIGDNY